MKPIISIAILLCVFHNMSTAHSQTAPLVDDVILGMLRIVEDPDGYTNLRSGPSLTSQVIGRMNSGGVVAIEPGQKGDWGKLAFDDLGETPRYIHTSRLRDLNRWKQIAITDHSNKKMGVLKLPGFEVHVLATPFVPADHVITRNPQGMGLVDGKSPWGRDGGLPHESLSIAVTQNGKSVEIPKAAVQNLYEPDMDSITLLTPSEPAERALVMMTNSDGAGAYCVVWAFEKGGYRGRVVFSPY